jgi:hypothetical protein
MSDQSKPIQRFLRKLHRTFLHTVPNNGPQEIDLSKLAPRTASNTDNSLEFSLDWRSPERPSDLPGQTKT